VRTGQTSTHVIYNTRPGVRVAGYSYQVDALGLKKLAREPRRT
jgi:hypothetical protein